MFTNTELAIIDELDTYSPVGEGAIGIDEESALEARPQTWARRAYERGMVTAEWAIGVVVAVSLAGLLLLFIVKGPAKEVITGIILKIINQVSGWGLKGA